MDTYVKIGAGAAVVIAVLVGVLSMGKSVPAQDAMVKTDAMQKEEMMQKDAIMKDGDAMMQKDEMMKKEMMMKESDAMMQKEMMMKESDAMMKKDEMMKGEIMQKDTIMKDAPAAGTYATYSPAKVTEATGKTVLFFRASWCPTCRALDSDIRANVRSIPVGVQILDVDYDTATALKAKYGVTAQHTLVQVDKAGAQLKKWSGSPALADLAAMIQ
jgi:thiol-disulfide isomerase/thioredoxin